MTKDPVCSEPSPPRNERNQKLCCLVRPIDAIKLFSSICRGFFAFVKIIHFQSTQRLFLVHFNKGIKVLIIMSISGLRLETNHSSQVSLFQSILGHFWPIVVRSQNLNERKSVSSILRFSRCTAQCQNSLIWMLSPRTVSPRISPLGGFIYILYFLGGNYLIGGFAQRGLIKLLDTCT